MTSRNCTVVTSTMRSDPPRWRAFNCNFGIRRRLSMGSSDFPLHKIVQHPQAIILALFRVELGGEDIVLMHRRRHGSAVVALGDRIVGIVAAQIIRMDEVKIGM